MNIYDIYHNLMNVKSHLQTIHDKGDDLNEGDAVTAAQYGIQDTMAHIIDELLETISSRCYERSRQIEGKVEHEVYGTYIEGEDKTAVWHNVYVDGELISSQLTGWYCGEPDEKTTAEYSKSNNTGYYLGDW